MSFDTQVLEVRGKKKILQKDRLGIAPMKQNLLILHLAGFEPVISLPE